MAEIEGGKVLRGKIRIPLAPTKCRPKPAWLGRGSQSPSRLSGVLRASGQSCLQVSLQLPDLREAVCLFIERSTVVISSSSDDADSKL